jgi:hypothetical protein
MDSTSIVCLILLLALGAGWSWRNRRTRISCQLQRAAIDMAPLPNQELNGLEETISEFVAEFKAVAESNLREFTAQTKQLKELIAAADARLAALKQVESGAASNSVGRETRATLMTDTLAESIYRLAEQDLDEAGIAKELGIGRGEVRLFLYLKRKERALAA